MNDIYDGARLPEDSTPEAAMKRLAATAAAYASGNYDGPRGEPLLPGLPPLSTGDSHAVCGGGSVSSMPNGWTAGTVPQVPGMYLVQWDDGAYGILEVGEAYVCVYNGIHARSGGALPDRPAVSYYGPVGEARGKDRVTVVCTGANPTSDA